MSSTKLLTKIILYLVKEYTGDVKDTSLDVIAESEKSSCSFLTIFVLCLSIVINAGLFYKFVKTAVDYTECMDNAKKTSSFSPGSPHWIAKANYKREEGSVCLKMNA